MAPVSEGGGHRSPGVLDVDPASSRVVADLRHPHLTAMKSVPDGVEPDAAGWSLAELQRAVDLPLRISLRILLDVLSGIAAIHHAKQDGKPIGFVHGEVAPANIIIGRDGVARLVPLSRGRGAGDANLVGYQAPELLLGDAVDQRADVFSAGVLLWEAMAGSRLFPDMPGEEIVTQLIGGKVAPPSAPRDAPWATELSAVAVKALDVDPSRRWPHVGALGSTIENIAHMYVAVPMELATFAAGAMTAGARSSFSSEATTKRRVLPDRPSTPPPESLAAVSTPLEPEPAPAAPPPVPMPLVQPVNVPVPLVQPANVPLPLVQQALPPTQAPADLGDSFDALSPPRSKGRGVIIFAVLAACVGLALYTGHKVMRNARGVSDIPVLTSPDLARPAAAAAPTREAPPPAPSVTGTAPPTAIPIALPVAAAPPASAPSKSSSRSAAKSASAPPAHAATPAPHPEPASAPAPAPPPPPAPAPAPAPPPAAAPAPAPAPAKPKSAADQFGI